MLEKCPTNQVFKLGALAQARRAMPTGPAMLCAMLPTGRGVMPFECRLSKDRQKRARSGDVRAMRQSAQPSPE